MAMYDYLSLIQGRKMSTSFTNVCCMKIKSLSGYSK